MHARKIYSTNGKNMSKQEKILDDLARLAGGTVGLMSDAKKQAASALKNRVDEWAQDMDLVPREDLERLQTSFQCSLDEIESLKKRIDVLEKALQIKNT